MEEAISVDVKNGVEARAGPIKCDHWSKFITWIKLITNGKNFLFGFCTDQTTKPKEFYIYYIYYTEFQIFVSTASTLMEPSPILL